MVWDATSPAGTDFISSGDEEIRELKTDITTALTTEGSFPGSDTANPKFRWTPPRGNTASRPASPVTGQLYLNTETVALERYNGASWDRLQLTGGITVESNGDITLGASRILKFALGSTTVNEFSIDGTLAGNSDAAVPTEKAVKTYVDTSMSSAFVSAGETWTYASSTTFTVSGDVTSKYQKGDKVKLSQTTVKYFYMTTVSHSAGTTTITVTGGSDYSLANAAITDNYYSKAENPQGFPGTFNYTPTVTGFSADAAHTGHFKIIGKLCFVQIRTTAGGTSNAVGYTISAPVTSENVGASTLSFVAIPSATDNSTVITTAFGEITFNSAVITVYKSAASTNWTNSGTKFVNPFTIIYPI